MGADPLAEKQLTNGGKDDDDQDVDDLHDGPAAEDEPTRMWTITSR